MLVLVADSDLRRQRVLCEALRQSWTDARMLCVRTGEDAVGSVRMRHMDLVLLATELTDQSGIEVLRAIRRASNVPVILLADSSADADQIEGLGLGADDYVVRPISGAVLAARIKAVLRRGEFCGVACRTAGQPDFRIGPLAMWFRQQEVTVAGSPVRLTPIEYRLLYQLAQHVGEVVPSPVLLEEVWGSDYGATTKYLKVFINRLRTKVARRGYDRFIETRRGVGYRLLDPGQ